MNELFTSPFAIFVFLYLIIPAILWILLPFALFGIKSLLRAQEQRQHEILHELRALRNHADVASRALLDRRDGG